MSNMSRAERFGLRPTKKKWQRCCVNVSSTHSAAFLPRFSTRTGCGTLSQTCGMDWPEGLLVPEDAVVYPPCAARFLMERARTHGAEIRLGPSVAQMGQGRVRTADGVEIAGRMIVNAAGAWSPDLTAGVEIKKRKGHLVITDRYPGFLRHQLVELGYLKSAHSVSSDSVAFNVQPRRTGQILIGSSRQYGAEHKDVDQHMLTRMLRRAQEYMPGLGTMSAVRTWTGFRAATPDKLPLIGPWPGDGTLFLATGHEGLGHHHLAGHGEDLGGPDHRREAGDPD